MSIVEPRSEIAEFAGRKPLSLAMEEIARGEVSYDKKSFEEAES